MCTTEIKENSLRNISLTDNYEANHLNIKKSEPLKVVRQYATPAVYVESSIYDMSPFRKNPLCHTYASDDEIYHKVLKVKRCCCLTKPNECPCHPVNDHSPDNGECSNRNGVCAFYSQQNSARDSLDVSQVSLKTSETGSTIKPANSELRLSIASLSTYTPSTCGFGDEQQHKEEVFQRWCARKSREKRRKEEEEARLKVQKEKDKAQLLEVERENFKKWLANKKKEEDRKKNELDKKLESEKEHEELKEKRRLENELRYQLWLKKKEEQMLEKKIKEQVDMLQRSEERQHRLDESLKAYNEWLKSSKNKPKPLPLNQGLQSLRSAVSVTYINPTPWIPNIEVESKPVSQ